MTDRTMSGRLSHTTRGGATVSASRCRPPSPLHASALGTAHDASDAAKQPLDTIKLGGHSLSLLPQIEHVATAPDGRVAAGVQVRCKVDGKQVEALTSGSVGIDSTREAALVTAAEEWAAGLHAMTITAVRKSDGAVDGEFRVDGEVWEPLKRLALQVKWPTSTGTYMLKQYYVMRAD